MDIHNVAINNDVVWEKYGIILLRETMKHVIGMNDAYQ